MTSPIPREPAQDDEPLQKLEDAIRDEINKTLVSATSCGSK